MKEITSSKLIFFTATLLIISGNFSFFNNILEIYPVNLKNGLFLFSLAIVFSCVNIILLAFLCHKLTIKPVLISIFLISSCSAYFMDTYHIIIDDTMIDNIIKTDMAEALDLFSIKQLLYILLLGIVPSVYVYKVKIIDPGLKKAFISRIKLISMSLITALAIILSLSSFYSSFFREHKTLRFYANPSYYLYSIGKYASSVFKNKSLPLQSMGLDARIPSSDVDRELIILVVGETARADHFSLNGYQRKTNPLLEKEVVISYTNVWSCGTSTAVSVPCLFSIYDRSDYSKNKAKSTENVLDILQHAGVNVIWLDNNSDSKGVADRVAYENYKKSDKNPICDTECRDEGMLSNLQDYIDKHTQGDIFIVLHQMGNHGPAYYKRYPKEFEKFTPVCQTNQLEQCSTEEINNTYDNAILYSDYFLSKTISLLKKNSDKFEAALFYISDHGESLGENNLFLHGLPYILAPEVQKRVPLILWFSENFDQNAINYDSLNKNINNNYSHDNIFHTLLGLMEVKTTAYDKKMDLIEHKEHH